MNNIVERSRLPNESDDELIYRICSAKDEIGSWNDVADLINQLTGNDYGESTYRKRFQAFQKILNANLNRLFDDDEYLNQIKIETDNLRKERIKLQTLNVERNRVDRNISRQELYYEQIGSTCATLPLPHFYPYSDNEYNSYQMEYLVTLADVHYGARFKSYSNEYSPDMAKQRFEYLAGCLIDFIGNHDINTIHIVSLGDLLQGMLRISDLKINDSTVVKSTVEISRIVAMFLNTISSYVNVHYYHVPTANHTQTRFLGSKANELMDEDLEYIIGHYIHDLCKDNQRIYVHLADDDAQFIQIPIFDYNIIAMHGHQIRNVDTALSELSMKCNKIIDYLLLGHYHTDRVINGYEGIYHDTEVLIAPSFIGSDPYADKIMKGNKASVKIYGFDKKYGHISDYKIVLN